MSSSDEQPENTLLPMLVTLSGIVMDFKPLQLANAQASMPVTPLPMVADVKLLQFWNALSPMFVTLSGIAMDVNPVQL